MNHGINTYRIDTQFTAVTKAQVGVPLFVGCFPIHKAGRAFSDRPILINNFDEAKDYGYSDAWRTVAGAPKWNLCQAAYAFLRLHAMSPAIFVNVFDPATHNKSTAAADFTVSDHAVTLPEDAINDANLVVKEDSTTLVKGTDYDVFYTDEACVVELKKTSAHYSATTLNVAFKEADISKVTSAMIEGAFEKVELCKTLYNIVPDLFCAPGWSKSTAVAAVMAAKAGHINDLFRAKAVVDIDTAVAAADTYDDVLSYKTANGYTDENMIVCWPLAKVGDRIYDMSVLVCAVMCRTDTNNGDLPYESASNKSISLSGLCNAAGDEILLTVQQANHLSYNAGVVTAMNFDGYRIWGNYTGCWPGNSDPAKAFYCASRMLDFLSNTFVNTFWSYVDRPLNRVLIDAIVNSFNSYLDGLTAINALLGGELRYVEDNNPTADLLAGRFRLDLQAASALPAQEINLFSEFSVDILTEALSV